MKFPFSGRFRDIAQEGLYILVPKPQAAKLRREYPEFIDESPWMDVELDLPDREEK